MSDKVIFLVYTDNTFLCVQDMEDADKCIRNDLQNAGMMLEVEDNDARFLRGHIDCQDDGTSSINMTQVGPSDRIIKALYMGDVSMKWTPAKHGCLGQDKWRDLPRDLQLCFCDWHATVPTRTHEARHNVCCEPMHAIYAQSKTLTWRSTAMDRMISKGDKEPWSD